jgi:hypothetical protein
VRFHLSSLVKYIDQVIPHSFCFVGFDYQISPGFPNSFLLKKVEKSDLFIAIKEMINSRKLAYSFG